MAYPNDYTFGTSTLQGGGTGLVPRTDQEILALVTEFQEPEFSVLKDDRALLRTQVTSEHDFGSEIEPGIFDYGNAVTFNVIETDKYGILADSTPLIPGTTEYLDINLSRLYGELGGVKFDQRVGVARFSIALRFESVEWDNAADAWVQNDSVMVGGRTLSLVGSVVSEWDIEDQQNTISYFEPIWSTSFLPVPSGINQFGIETQHLSYNLLNIRRKAIAIWETENNRPYPLPPSTLRLNIGAFFHHTSPSNLRVVLGNFWIKRIGAGSDPEQYNA